MNIPNQLLVIAFTCDGKLKLYGNKIYLRNKEAYQEYFTALGEHPDAVMVRIIPKEQADGDGPHEADSLTMRLLEQMEKSEHV